MSEQHSAKINCPRSHCRSLYHIFISLNDEGVMGKVEKLLSSTMFIIGFAHPSHAFLQATSLRGQAFKLVDDRVRTNTIRSSNSFPRTFWSGLGQSSGN